MPAIQRAIASAILGSAALLLPAVRAGQAVDSRGSELPEIVYRSFQARDYKRAYPVLEKLAAADHQEAAFWLGNYYLCARVVKFDCAKAQELFQKSARPSSSRNSADLVAMSKNEIAWINAACEQPGFSRDAELALKVGKEAAADGNPFRLDTLAAAYANAGDYPKAIALQSQALRALDALGRTEPVEDYTAKEFSRRLALYKRARPARFDARSADENCNALP